MRNTLRVPLLCAFCVWCLPADTVTMSTGTFTLFPSLSALNDPTTGQNGSLAFWANKSVDGLTDPTNLSSPLKTYSQQNVGNFLTGTCGPTAATVGSCPAGTFNGEATPNINPTTTSLGYYANGSLPISSFYFTRDGSSNLLSPDLIDTANIIQLGWYDAGSPNTETAMFSNLTGSAALPGGYNLNNIPLGTNYGFYAIVNYGNGYLATYYTQSQYDTFTAPASQSFASMLGSDMVDGALKQHFAIFTDTAQPTIGTIAIEDSVGATGYEGMGDYQDAVFGTSLTAVSLAATPEPATLWMAGLGLAGAFSTRRWLRRSTEDPRICAKPGAATNRSLKASNKLKSAA